MTFAVWAPIPRDVKLNLADAVIPMTRDHDGWWTAPARAEGIDARYGFLLDDDPVPVPDPRSRWQPNGVHDRSHTFDPTAFAWTDAQWPGRSLPGGVIYELHIGTFTPDGTLDAAVERLPHLVELGIDFVELLPVNSFNGTHNWGYDGVLWYSVDDTYGGPQAYQRFVDACHGQGLAVIQDVVYNHLGPSGNHLPRFGPYLRDDRTSPWGPSINLVSEEVRRYILDNAAMWMRDYHVDGLRLDAVHALGDPTPVHILRELADETAALSVEVGRPLTLIAESDLNDPTMVMPSPHGGYGIDAQWSDDFHHAVHVALTRETNGYYADFEGLSSLAKVITKGFFHDGIYSSFRDRVHGAPLDTDHVPAWRLVVASQTHDQIGNRAIGDRLTASLDAGQLAIAAVLTLSSPFTPMLFMGEEWGASTPWQFFTGHPEPELGRATAEGRLAEFERMGWDRTVVPDPQAPTTFEDSKLDWTELASPSATQLLDLYRSLIRFRRQRPSLADGDFTAMSVERDEAGRWIAIHRRGGPTTVANFSTDRVTLPYAGELVLSTDRSSTIDTHLHLAPHSAAIIDRSPR